jgi:methyl-accepting chemotaxis protein
MLNNVPIARKLSLLCAVFVLPVVFLAWLLLSNGYRAVDFAADEVEGVAYVQAVSDVMIAVSERQRVLRYGFDVTQGGIVSNVVPEKGALDAALREAVQRWEQVDQRLGAKMKLQVSAQKVREEVALLLDTVPQAAGQQAVAVRALGALKDLAVRAADGSKLILDPDLDSYYVMDLMVLRIPKMIYEADSAVALLATTHAATPVEQVRLLETLTKLRQAARDGQQGIALAAENNESGIVAGDLQHQINALVPQIEQTAQLIELNGRMVQGGTGYDRTSVLTADEELLNALIGLQKTAGQTLDQILTTRITVLETGLFASLGVSALILAGAVMLAWTIARGISVPLLRLEDLMVRLADGETDIDVPELDRDDEVGRMAKALAVFRLNARRTVRMRVALNCVGTPVLVANSEGLMTDVNNAARQHFSLHAQEIEQAVGGFSIDECQDKPLAPLFGASTALAVCDLSEKAEGRVILGPRHFDVRVSPIISSRGEHLGTVSEWSDVTERLRMEAEVARLVDAAIVGDFSHRLPVQGDNQFLCLLAERMNALLDTISSSLEGLVEVNGALARGDLARRIDRTYEGAFQKLTDNTNQMAERLADIVQKIAEAAHTVHNASAEISQGSEDLASRTEQQAANLEETAAAMEELALTVRQNAHNAQQADGLANAARESAQKGGSMVEPAMIAMGRIEESSGKISEITTVIEEIAFQTNLLALNAAVEAARAGDAGRGFAVVAAEVRQLAQRTSRSSKEIKGIVQRSNSEVQEGVKLVGSVGTALAEIVAGISAVADIIAEIAGAGREQSSGLDEVNAAVAQMDEMTQQNAALVEETTAAAHSLSVQAEGLVELVSYFHLEKGEPSAQAAKADHRRPRSEGMGRWASSRPLSKTAGGGQGGSARRSGSRPDERAQGTKPFDEDWSEF